MTDQQKQEALRLYKSGVTVKNIPHLIGSTNGAVQRYLYKTLQVRARNHKYKVSDLSVIKRLRMQGKKESEILDITGMKRNQLRYLLRSYGVGFRVFDRETY